MTIRRRRGNYSMLSALMILVMVGFGAISVDLSMVRLGASQSQDIADAASQAAIVMYRHARSLGRSDLESRALGERAAEVIALRNRVVGVPPTVRSVAWGEWDPTASLGNEFQTTAVDEGTTAVQVALDRSGDSAIGLPFGALLGWTTMPVRGAATSASRNVEAILTIDVTGSWDKEEFQHARDAAVAFFDTLAENHGPEDRFGVVVWFNSYAYEYVPLMRIDDALAHPELARDLLLKLNVANYAGVAMPAWAPPLTASKHVACRVFGTDGSGAMPFGSSTGYNNSLKNRWSNGASPGRGCAPNMPRYYVSVEGGTDHHTGLMLARSLLRAQQSYVPGTGWVSSVGNLGYRAVVMLTDGEPVAISAPGSHRSAHVTGTGNTSTAAVPTASTWTWKDTAYPETWHATAPIGAGLREYRRDTAHSLAAIKSDTVSLAANMAAVDSANIWVVSFRDDNAFLASASVGDGYYSYVPTGDVASLVGVFEEIARTLPTAIVK